MVNPYNPLEWWRMPLSQLGLAPEDLVQSVLAGWFSTTVNINSENSASPETERQILRVASYGRQLGRVMDALEVLLKRATPESPDEKQALDAFQEIYDKVKGVKSDLAHKDLSMAAVDRLVADLTALKDADRPQYERVSARLRTALAPGDASPRRRTKPAAAEGGSPIDVEAVKPPAS